MDRHSQVGRSHVPDVRARRRAGGFTYLGILLAIVFVGIGLAAVGTLWTTTMRREREAQLLFAGDAIRSAIESYYRSGPGGQLPQELGDLLDDKRSPLPRRHLRRLYLDPMTGQVDWQIIRDPGGGIIGVNSSSQSVPLKRANFEDQDAQFTGSECYCQWRFEFNARATFRRRR